MKKLALTAYLILHTTFVSAGTLIGKVVAIADGDTVTVLDENSTQHKIRLSGIDAPEKKQAFGAASKKSLSDMIYLKTVSVDWHKQDRYGRIVGKVLLAGNDVNLEQLKLGMAWFYRQYQNEQPLQDRLDYLHAEEAARAAKNGLWSDNDPLAPWDFRKKH